MRLVFSGRVPEINITTIKLRWFEVKEMKHFEFGNGENGLYFAQDNPNAEDGQDYVFFTKDQIPTIIEWLKSEIGQPSKKYETIEAWTADLVIQQDNYNVEVEIIAGSEGGLYITKDYIYETVIEDMSKIQYQRNGLELKNIKKITVLKEEN